jgi:hypothetical protein
MSAYFIGSYMVEYDGFDNQQSVGNYKVPLAYAFVTIISLICLIAAIFRRYGCIVRGDMRGMR